MKFYQWYSQAFGGVLGIASCIYCYVKGDLLMYSKLSGNFDIINFNGILASYILYPLCFLTFIMAVLVAMPNMAQKKILNTDLPKVNSYLVYLTVVVGILGCGIYFIIPALLILLKDLLYAFKRYKSKHANKTTNNNTDEYNQEPKNTSAQLLSTKTEMAINLLNNNANINFITDVTGLSEDYISKLKKETND